MLTEGGNVFKDAQKQVLTRRINQAEIMPTVKWLETVTGLDLTSDINPKTGLPRKWLGSTGKKPTSGDLDLQVDANEISKDELVNRLSQWVTKNKLGDQEYVAKSGVSVHFLTPIGGDAKRGYAQTDFMFTHKPRWNQFVLYTDPTSDFKGASRNVLINSMAKSLGYKLNQNDGIMDRNSNQLITDDPDKTAQLLLNPRATEEDLGSVERIMAVLKTDPQRDKKIADFLDHMQRQGTPFSESVTWNEVNWLARLRDRVVNQGLSVLIEQEQVKRDPRWPHPEDAIFLKGSKQSQQVVQALSRAVAQPRNVTIKWDGKPALIFGRLPNGRLAVMDKYMFDAKYAAQSPDDWIKYDRNKPSGKMRTNLYPMLRQLWPGLNAAVKGPGFYWGDMMWAGELKPTSGRYQFRPSEVTYTVDRSSPLYPEIAGKRGGVVVHRVYSGLGDTASSPWNGNGLESVPGGVLIIKPNLGQPLKANPSGAAETLAVIKKHGKAVDAMLEQLPVSTRQRLQTYYNQKLTGGTGLSLVNWLPGNVSAVQLKNLVGSTTKNADGSQKQEPGLLVAPDPATGEPRPTPAYQGLEDIFNAVYNFKIGLLSQLAPQVQGLGQSVAGQPEGEGFMVDTTLGPMKLVNRGVFSSALMAKNR
jgi:hypothetical protein